MISWTLCKESRRTWVAQNVQQRVFRSYPDLKTGKIWTRSKQGSYKNQDYPKFQLEKVQNKAVGGGGAYLFCSSVRHRTLCTGRARHKHASEACTGGAQSFRYHNWIWNMFWKSATNFLNFKYIPIPLRWGHSWHWNTHLGDFLS